MSKIRAAIRAVPGARNALALLRFGQFQINLRRAEANDRDFPRDRRGLPIPPARLRHRVHGDFDRERFLQVGETVSGELRTLVALAGREWASFANILDFGCGCARVARYFTGPGNGAKLFGTDIDAELVTWCQKNIPGVDWRINPFMPPTTYADGAFDLVYAISVFTHLDESFQIAWLSELHRVTRPGAVLVLTVHGEPVIAKIFEAQAQRRLLDDTGFLFVKGTTGKLKVDGLPDFYQTSFHKTGYIQRVWGQYFEVVRQVPEGINHHQDAVVLRRR